MSGDRPEQVPDRILDEIQRREVRGAVELPKLPGMKAGDRVRVLGGPFKGFAGLYHGMSGRQRVEVLLSILGGQRSVTLPRSDIELAPDSGEL
jgi:transcriptional antiterminator RfaH